MVSVKKNIKDINKYTWETVYFVSKPLIVIGIICIPLIVYFFVVGNLPNPNKELLRYGYTLLFLLVIMIINGIRLYFYYKKNLKFYYALNYQCPSYVHLQFYLVQLQLV